MSSRPSFSTSHPDSLSSPPEGNARGLSWWREAVQFARWQPLGFGAASYLLVLFVRPFDEFMLLWMLGWAVPALWRREPWRDPGKYGRAALLWAAGFLAWMWLGMFRGTREMPREWLMEGANVVATVLLITGLWRTAQRPSRLDWLMRGLAGIGGLTAAVSLGIFISTGGRGMYDGRLQNMAVFFGSGLHPVNSGLMWAFAAMASAAALSQARSLWTVAGHGVLLALLSGAVFLTQTRGAVLGLAAAVMALAVLRPFKSWIPAMALILGMGWACQQLPDLMTAGAVMTAPSQEMAAAAPGAATAPVTGMIARSDNGRFPLYKELWSRVEGTWEIIAGRGFWACDNAMAGEIHWQAPHPHGAFLGTFYHGGLIGLTLVLGLLWQAGRAGWWLARRNLDVRWTVLLACGLAGLIFDGHSLALLRTVPMVEPLLFWFPLITGVALAAKVRDDLPV